MIFQWDNNITRFICLSPCWSLFLRVSGASGACWMGRRPSHCGKQPAGAQHHTHCSRRADEQPTGGTQLWGTNTHTHTSLIHLSLLRVAVCNEPLLSSPPSGESFSQLQEQLLWNSGQAGAPILQTTGQSHFKSCGFVCVWGDTRLLGAPPSSVNPIRPWQDSHAQNTQLCICSLFAPPPPHPNLCSRLFVPSILDS